MSTRREFKISASTFCSPLECDSHAEIRCTSEPFACIEEIPSSRSIQDGISFLHICKVYDVKHKRDVFRQLVSQCQVPSCEAVDNLVAEAACRERLVELRLMKNRDARREVAVVVADGDVAIELRLSLHLLLRFLHHAAVDRDLNRK